MRAAVDFTVIREPAQPRHGEAGRLAERGDIGERRQRVVLPLALGVVGVEAIDVGRVVPEHAGAEVDDVRALVRLPRLLVELAANAALFFTPRLVELLLGVVHRRRAARVGQPARRDLRIHPFADATLRGDVRPVEERDISFRRHTSPSENKIGGGVEARYIPHGTR
jgi:hypothetical protein